MLYSKKITETLLNFWTNLMVDSSFESSVDIGCVNIKFDTVILFMYHASITGE